MPLTTAYVQSVELEGTMYMGGGRANRDENDYVVMAYDMQSFKWHTLPPYSARWFAMTTINNKLILVGGCNHNGVVDQIGVWQTDSNQWACPFPPMPTPRFSPSPTSYEHWLVVAGGYRSDDCFSTVEVLDVDNKQWSTAPSIPTTWWNMKSTIIGDTWYLMGESHDTYTTDVYSVSLEALVSPSASNSSKIWNKLAPLNYISSSPLSVGGSLLVLGGWNKNNSRMSTIQSYVPGVHVGELPKSLYIYTSIMSAGRLHVFGGLSGEIGTCYYFSDILK